MQIIPKGIANHEGGVPRGAGSYTEAGRRGREMQNTPKGIANRGRRKLMGGWEGVGREMQFTP